MCHRWYMHDLSEAQAGLQRPSAATPAPPLSSLLTHLGGGQAEHGLGQLRLQLVKHGGAQALGAAPHHAGDLAAAGLATCAHRVDGCGRRRRARTQAHMGQCKGSMCGTQGGRVLLVLST